MRALPALALLLAACAAPGREPEREPAPEPVPAGNAIVVCGERFRVEAPVVLWFEEPYYSAYETGPRFAATESAAPDGLRYRPGRNVRNAGLRAHVEREGWTLGALRQTIDQFVLHYDVCGTSQRCFRVLQDLRGLSVHFLLDVDGTIYQTLDLEEQAWHARQANPRSIGIEIAQIGAYPPEASSPLDAWYRERADGVHLTLPASVAGTDRGGVRTPDFEGRPARDGRLTGTIQGSLLEQYDFTPEQYASLIELTRTLTRVFPRIEHDAPRDATGAVRSGVLSDAEFEAFRGILGHYHVSEAKVDPGPAFDWERYLAEVRAKP